MNWNASGGRRNAPYLSRADSRASDDAITEYMFESWQNVDFETDCLDKAIMTAPRLSVQLIASFVLALAAAASAPQIVLHFARNNQVLATNMFALSAFILGPLWVVLAWIILHNHGKRALWVLIGFPFALYSTVLALFFAWGCVTGRGCL